MPKLRKSLLYGAVAALLVRMTCAVVMRSLKRATTALLMLCVFSTLALGKPSGMFGPAQNPPRAASVGLSPDEERQIAATLSECEAAAIELDATREEAAVLRRALDLTTKAAAAFEAASTANAERAENERKRAENEAFLRATAESNLRKEKRAGKWRAIKWATVALAAGVVVGVVMGGE